MACWSRHRIFGRRSLRQDRRSGFCVWCNLLAWAHLLRRRTVSHQITFAWRRILFHQIIWFFSRQRNFFHCSSFSFDAALQDWEGREIWWWRWWRCWRSDGGDVGDLMLEMVEMLVFWWWRWWRSDGGRWSVATFRLETGNGAQTSDEFGALPHFTAMSGQLVLGFLSLWSYLHLQPLLISLVNFGCCVHFSLGCDLTCFFPKCLWLSAVMLLWCPSHLQIVLCTRTFNHKKHLKEDYRIKLSIPTDMKYL